MLDSRLDSGLPWFVNLQLHQNKFTNPLSTGYFSCVPPGAICCSDNYTYVMPPDNCPDGTQPITTAGDGGGSTAIEPLPTTDVLNEVWYTTEFTWYYWYYYYTFIDVSTVFTSIEYTSVTTLSITATDSAQASSLFNEFSATAIFPTPTQTTTALSGSVTKSTPPMTMTATSDNTVSTSKPTAVVAAGARAAATGDWVLLTLGVGLFCLVPGFLTFCSFELDILASRVEDIPGPGPSTSTVAENVPFTS
ncbi:hypothetical protein FOXYSP1_21020 [Fusarium oxysporum f. sp. phaseoli]